MLHFLIITPITAILFALLSLFCFLIYWDSRKTKNNAKQIDDLPTAPGPRSYPIIGSMHLLGKYDVPYKAFGDLAQIYGPIFKMDLGSVPSLVVNGQENIREVLMTKGAHFDSRPNFRRYHQLFCGDKENSLAFCNWSELQKSRREILRTHAFPTSFSSRFHELDDIILGEIPSMLKQITTNNLVAKDLKPIILKTCANIFTEYFCSQKFLTNDAEFHKMVTNYDEIFYEVNQGYAADFLPFLLPFHTRHFSRIANWSHEIRNFILNRIIKERFDNFEDGITETKDYVDSLIEHVKLNKKPSLEWETALFALEDIVGGHSAIGNLLVKVLGFIVDKPEIQKNIQTEIDECIKNKNDDVDSTFLPEVDIFSTEHYEETETEDNVTEVNNNDMKNTEEVYKGRVSIKDRNKMPYTEAVILEAIRLIASPIVPHVANQDSSVAGFKVPKDTLVFLNNYDLNMSEKLWDEPEKFMPERFIKNGRVQKPDCFLPFGGGKRSCMGYKMVQLIGFSVIANLFQSFSLVPVEKENYKVPIGNLALPTKGVFKFGIQKRETVHF